MAAKVFSIPRATCPMLTSMHEPATGLTAAWYIIQRTSSTCPVPLPNGPARSALSDRLTEGRLP